MIKKPWAVFAKMATTTFLSGLVLAVFALPHYWTLFANRFDVTNQCGTTPLGIAWHLSAGVNHVLATVLAAVLTVEAGLFGVFALVCATLSVNNWAWRKSDSKNDDAEAERNHRVRLQNRVAALQIAMTVKKLKALNPVVVTPKTMTHRSGILRLYRDLLFHFWYVYSIQITAIVAGCFGCLAAYTLPRECLRPNQVVEMLVSTFIYAAAIAAIPTGLFHRFFVKPRAIEAESRRLNCLTDNDIRYLQATYAHEDSERPNPAIKRKLEHIVGVNDISFAKRGFTLRICSSSSAFRYVNIVWDLDEHAYIWSTFGARCKYSLKSHENTPILIGIARCSSVITEAVQTMIELGEATMLACDTGKMSVHVDPVSVETLKKRK